MDKRNMGIYEKFNVSRNDGRDLPGFKHHGCKYFVLDITHDQFAIPALKAYADACFAEYPVLSNELTELVAARQESKESSGTASNSDLMQLLCDIKERVDVEGGFDSNDYSVYSRLDAVIAQQH